MALSTVDLPPDLDAWLAAPAVRVHHHQHVGAGAEAAWDAAQDVRLDDTRTLGRLVRWRIPETPGDLTFHELFRTYPFTVLEEGRGWSLSGLCGRIWTLSRDYPALADAAAFRAWDEPGTVKVLFAHWVEAQGEHDSRLVSEARVEPLDRSSAKRLRALWLLIGVFERLITQEPLVVAARRAES